MRKNAKQSRHVLSYNPKKPEEIWQVEISAGFYGLDV